MKLHLPLLLGGVSHPQIHIKYTIPRSSKLAFFKALHWAYEHQGLYMNPQICQTILLLLYESLVEIARFYWADFSCWMYVKTIGRLTCGTMSSGEAWLLMTHKNNSFSCAETPKCPSFQFQDASLPSSKTRVIVIPHLNKTPPQQFVPFTTNTCEGHVVQPPTTSFPRLKLLHRTMHKL